MCIHVLAQTHVIVLNGRRSSHVWEARKIGYKCVMLYIYKGGMVVPGAEKSGAID